MSFYIEGHVLVGISGGAFSILSAGTIAYIQQKICRNVRIIATSSSEKFLSLTGLEYLTGNSVISDFSNGNVEHINLTQWADIFLIIPASANTLSKCANAIADNELTTAVMAAQCPIVFYPGMNERMWHNKLLQENIKKLERSGYYLSYANDKKLTLYNHEVSEQVVHPDLKQVENDVERLMVNFEEGEEQ